MTKNKEKFSGFEDMEKSTFDLDEIEDTDIKINPSYYIHIALIKAQNALVKEDYKGGFAQYTFIIEHLEIICRSAKIITSDYSEKVDVFKKSEDYLESPGDLSKSVRLANFKLTLLTKEIFENKTITSPLKDKNELDKV